jgi:uncharacterized protein YjbJ (UPF0337 family)
MKFNVAGFVKRGAIAATGGCLALFLVLQGAFTGFNGAAIAAPLGTFNLVATSTSSIAKEVEGKAKQDLGAVQKNLSRVSGQIEGTANQIKGRAMQDMGKTQAKVEDKQLAIKSRARKDLNKTENVLDQASNRITERTNKVGDKVSEATENTVDSIKSFFGQ